MIEKNPIFKPNYFGFFATTLLLGAVLIWMEPLTIPLVQIALIIAYKLGMKRHKLLLEAYSEYLNGMIENVQKDNHYAIAYMQVGIGDFSDHGLLQ